MICAYYQFQSVIRSCYENITLRRSKLTEKSKNVFQKENLSTETSLSTTPSVSKIFDQVVITLYYLRSTSYRARRWVVERVHSG